MKHIAAQFVAPLVFLMFEGAYRKVLSWVWPLERSGGIRGRVKGEW